MSGIPVHTSSPLNPNQTTTTAAAAATTAPPTSVPSHEAQNTPATSTLPANSPSQYPSAQPGAPAIPAPTGAPSSAHPAPTATISVAPTTASAQQIPPPPQPGAAPVPQNARAAATSAAHPPPPRAVEPPPLHSHQQQGNLIDPTTTARAQPPAATTATAAGHPSRTVDLSHPPGYVQDSNASFRDRPGAAYDSLQNQSQMSARGATEGLLGSNADELGGGKTWFETATDWTKKAGEKLAEGHDEIWKKINNEK
ncbi:MAG: hypothetical protein Q9227_001743 [Pyrenula ochraceoflavens]